MHPDSYQGDKTGIADDAVSVVIAGATLYIPFAELVDIAAEKERLEEGEEAPRRRAEEIREHAHQREVPFQGSPGQDRRREKNREHMKSR